MEAALVLKERGMTPVIYEAADHLGGQFITAGRAPGKEEMGASAFDMAKRVERDGIEVHLNSKIDETFEYSFFDEVIVSLGASPITMGLSISNAHEVLNGEKEVIPCDNVVVAIGAKANDSSAIQAKCEELGKPVHVIGDAVKARRAMNSIHEGFDIARKI